MTAISRLVAGLCFLTSILAQSQSDCGPITFTSEYGPLFVEENGNLTVPFDNNTALPGSQSGSSFYIGTDSRMFTLAPNSTRLYCDPFIWMRCTMDSEAVNSTTMQRHSDFTIGSDGFLYVRENSDFNLATEFSETTDRPFPSHLFPAFQGTQAFTRIEGRRWGWTTIQLKASGCYDGELVDGRTAPTPTISNGAPVDVAATTARSVIMGFGGAVLGLAAFL